MKYLFLFLGLVMSQYSFAQCETCDMPAASDFCYTDDLFEGYCAAFAEGEDTFQFTSGKKVRNLPLAAEVDTPYYLELTNNKKLKIKPQDLLFIQLALAEWATEKMMIGYTFDDQGLGIRILEEGTGTIPAKGENIKVHYSGFLLDGTKFDSSVDRGMPIEFAVGTGRVIKGWDLALSQMKRGTKARILIPSELGYGSRGAGGAIPPNATLIFELELIE